MNSVQIEAALALVLTLRTAGVCPRHSDRISEAALAVMEDPTPEAVSALRKAGHNARTAVTAYGREYRGGSVNVSGPAMTLALAVENAGSGHDRDVAHYVAVACHVATKLLGTITTTRQ